MLPTKITIVYFLDDFEEVLKTEDHVQCLKMCKFLWPLLFPTYISDLSNSTSRNPCLFADDTCLVVSNSSFSSLEQRCNAELENLKNWCNANKLQINPNKSMRIYVPSKLYMNEAKLKILYNNCTLAY